MISRIDIFKKTGLNPNPNNLPKFDPKDDFLLADPSSSTGVYPINGSQSGSINGHPTPLAHVPWLRKTEYISREGVQKTGVQEPLVLIKMQNRPLTFFFFCAYLCVYRKHVMVASIDVSRDAQLRDIEASFQACNENFNLESLHHPNKPNVTAVESYPVLPDVDIWANQYDLFRFSERPGERSVDVCAFLQNTFTF